MKFASTILLSAAFTVSLFAIGCGEAERLIDCAQICDKYKTCVDGDLDKGDCVESCEDHGDDDHDFQDQASECEDCLDGKSCTEATVACTPECAGVISSST